MILKGKKVLIAGMSDRRSIGYAIAVEAQREGAELLLTSFGRMMSITEMTAKKLNPVPDILEMDVTKPADIKAALAETSKRWDRIDGLVHSVAYAPPDALGGQFLNSALIGIAVTLIAVALAIVTLSALPLTCSPSKQPMAAIMISASVAPLRFALAKRSKASWLYPSRCCSC